MPDPAWPAWRGRTVAVVASGPSAKAANPGQLKGLGVPVLAIKRSWELVPFCEAIYGCDRGWWDAVAGLPEFKGLKLAYATSAVDAWGLARVHIPEPRNDALRFGKTGEVGAGGNSGFHAMNLAVQWGAARVLLVGFDMHERGGKHWYGRNTAFRMSNPDEDNFRRWRKAFDGAAQTLATMGVDVVNCSPSSEIKAFRKASITDALAEWGMA